MADHPTDRDATGAAVVETQQWLRQAVEARLEAADYDRAVLYLNRLLGIAADLGTRMYCYEHLGMLAFRAGQVREAREAFENAAELTPTDPGVAYALGHCAAADRDWWRALLHSLEAFYRADDPADEAEFIRTGAIAIDRLGQPDAALSMLLGALDRSPDNPWIMETVASFYEGRQRWWDALDVREALIDVLTDAIDHDTRRPSSPEADRIVRRFRALLTIDRQAVAERAGHIKAQLRAQIGLVPTGGDLGGAAELAGELTPLRLPAALHRLVEQLAYHDRNFQLLETAQSLWARARHERFDVHLTPYTLAAAIHSIAERLHWRRPTPTVELARSYGVDADTLGAAVRLVAGRYGVAFIDLGRTPCSLQPEAQQRFDAIQRAILWGADLDELTSSVAMLT